MPEILYILFSLGPSGPSITRVADWYRDEEQTRRSSCHCHLSKSNLAALVLSVHINTRILCPRRAKVKNYFNAPGRIRARDEAHPLPPRGGRACAPNLAPSGRSDGSCFPRGMTEILEIPRHWYSNPISAFMTRTPTFFARCTVLTRPRARLHFTVTAHFIQSRHPFLSPHPNMLDTYRASVGIA